MSTPSENEKVFIKCAKKIECANFQSVNNHYAKFKHKETNNAEVEYTNQTPSKYFVWKKCVFISPRSTPLKMKKNIHEMCKK